MTEYPIRSVKEVIGKENFFIIVATLAFGLLSIFNIISFISAVVASLVLATVIMIFYYA